MDPISLIGMLGPSLISVLGSLFGGKKATPSLDPQQQALMNAALRIQNNRMLLQNPLFEQVTQGAMSRQPRSAIPANYQLENLLQQGTGEVGARPLPAGAQVTGRAKRRGTNTSAAVSQLSQGMRQPQSYS